MMIFLRAAILAIVLVWTTGAVAGSLTLVLTGETFDEPPVLELKSEGRLIARVSLTSALDTRTGRRLGDADPADFSQSFTFDLSATPIDPLQPLELHFLNDKWLGNDTGIDRNVFLMSADFDGVPIPIEAIDLHSDAGPVTPRRMWRGMIPLRNSSLFAVIPPPPDGWRSEATLAAK